MDGVDRLREKRGREHVTFDDVADHMEDFVRRAPEHGSFVDDFAAFLAGVEDVDHEHDGDTPTVGPAAAVG